MKTDEKTLVEQMRQGHIGAFQELVERYKKKVYYLAYDMVDDHHEAEDISQEVFIKVFRFIKKFRKDAKFSSWLYQITVNTCIDVKRKKSSKPQISMEDSQIENIHHTEPAYSRTDSSIHNPEHLAETDMIQQRIHQALTKISPRERSVFVMRYYNDFKTGEIAEILNVSINTIKSLLLRAKRKLQKELSFYQGKPGTEVLHD
jgi:RNA polymerase sigma-70 factor (ECF subfamily)